MIIVAAVLSLVIEKNYYPKMPHVWVEITKPTLACYTLDDDWKFQSKAIKTLKENLSYWSEMGFVPKGCELLKKGRRLELSMEQSFESVHFNDYCLPGCSPWKWSTFGPSEKLVGEYMKPAEMPDNFKQYLK